MLFIKRAVPSDFSYVRSDSSGTSIPAEPAGKVANENVCPILQAPNLSPVPYNFLEPHRVATFALGSHGERPHIESEQVIKGSSIAAVTLSEGVKSNAELYTLRR